MNEKTPTLKMVRHICNMQSVPKTGDSLSPNSQKAAEDAECVETFGGRQ